MKITCISDLHGHYPELPGGDLLIVAGDLTASDKEKQYWKFHEWIENQPYRKKVVIAGNHDNLVQKDASIMEPFGKMFDYLCDSGTEFEGLKIWGTPWTPWFYGVNPHCKAFMLSGSEIRKKFALIPDDIDILICHGPMLYCLDKNIEGKHCGSTSLKDAIDRVKPRLFIFGHIHECGAQEIIYEYMGTNTRCVNASHVNERYQPVNKPMEIEI